MLQNTNPKEIPFVPAIVALGDGHEIKVDERGIIISSTNKGLLGKQYCEPIWTSKGGGAVKKHLLITFVETETGWDYSLNGAITETKIREVLEELGVAKAEELTSVCEEIKQVLAE